MYTPRTPPTPYRAMPYYTEERTRPSTPMPSHSSSVDTVHSSPVPQRPSLVRENFSLQLEGQIIQKCTEIQDRLRDLHQDYKDHQNDHADPDGPIHQCCVNNTCDDLQYRRRAETNSLLLKAQRCYAQLRSIHIVHKWETEKEQEWVRLGLISTNGNWPGGVVQKIFEEMFEEGGIFGPQGERTRAEDWNEAAGDLRVVFSQPGRINYNRGSV